ncbi:MAG TPA: dienelactone hydrolase family protein [Arachidicoccus sp.]
MKKIQSIIAAFFVLSSFCACAQNNAHSITYKQGSTELEGYLRKPVKAGKAPGVVILHAWMGLTDHEENTADRLSKLGYYALAADVYGKGIHPANAQQAGKLAMEYETADYKVYIERIQTAIDEIIRQGADPNNIVVIGYCFGGFGAIEAARNNMPIKGIVSFHGGLLKDPSGAESPIKPKLLILHGNDDPTQPKNADVDFRSEMETRNADYQMMYFGHTVHSFTDKTAGNDIRKGVAYNESSNKRSWQYMLDFLHEIVNK